MTAPIALVTGGGRRLGAVFAQHLADQGYDVGIHYSDSQKSAQAVAEAIDHKGRRSALLHADLAIPASHDGLIDACTRALGPPSVLINNAAPYVPDNAAMPEAAQWDLHMTVIARAPAWLAARLAQNLPDGQTGAVINILDESLGKILTVQHFSYTAAKAALAAITRLQAKALAPRVRVNALAPGLTLRTDPQTQEEFERVHDLTPLRRGSRPDDLCAAIDYLLAAHAVSGETLTVDGGSNLR